MLNLVYLKCLFLWAHIVEVCRIKKVKQYNESCFGNEELFLMVISINIIIASLCQWVEIAKTPI